MMLARIGIKAHPTQSYQLSVHETNKNRPFSTLLAVSIAVRGLIITKLATAATTVEPIATHPRPRRLVPNLAVRVILRPCRLSRQGNSKSDRVTSRPQVEVCLARPKSSVRRSVLLLGHCFAVSEPAKIRELNLTGPSHATSASMSPSSSGCVFASRMHAGVWRMVSARCLDSNSLRAHARHAVLALRR